MCSWRIVEQAFRYAEMCLQLLANMLKLPIETSLNWNYLEKWSTSTCRNRSNVLQLPSTHPLWWQLPVYVWYFNHSISELSCLQFAHVCTCLHNPFDMCRIGFKMFQGFQTWIPAATASRTSADFQIFILGSPAFHRGKSSKNCRWPWVYPGRNSDEKGPCWDSRCNWWQNSWTSDIIVNPDHLQSSWRTKQKNMFHPSTKDPCVAKFPIFKLLWGFQGPRKLQAAVSQSNFIPVDLPALVSGNGELLDIEGY